MATIRSPTSTPASSAGVFGNTRSTVIDPLIGSPMYIPVPPYRPPVPRVNSSLALGVSSSLYGSLSSRTSPLAAFSYSAAAFTVSTN